MNPIIDTTDAVWESFELRQLLSALQHQQGVDVVGLLAEVGISSEVLATSPAKVTLEQEVALYSRIANVNRNPMLALNHGKATSIVQCGLLGQTMQSCDTLLAAVQAMERYASLFSWNMRLRLHQVQVQGQRAYGLRMIPCPLDECANIFEVESTFATFKRIFHEILLDNLTLLEVRFSHQMDTDVKQAFEDYMGCPVRGGAEHNEMIFPLQVLDRKLPYGDPLLREMLLNLCQKELQEMECHTSLLWQVSHFLETCEHPTSIEQCASHFCLSSRTLRRKLKQYGTSFQELLDKYRFDVARQHLTGSHICLDVLARQLGFSEVRSFRVAFKRWSGQTPSEFRQQASVLR